MQDLLESGETISEQCPENAAGECLFLSIVIPVRNEERHIAHVLDRLLAQDYPPERWEAILVDGRSTDATREIVTRYAERHSNIHCHENPKRLSSAARNIGIDHMRGDVFLLIDGHCLIESGDMLKAVDRAFRHEKSDCLGRPQPLEMRGAGFRQHAIAAARRSPLGHHPDSFIYAGKACWAPAISVGVAYRKAVFETVGRFDERFDAAEDVEFNHRCDRAGLRCFFDPAIAVYYVPRKTLRGLFRQLVRYGRGRVRLTRKHPDTFSMKSFLPAIFLAVVLIGLPLAFFHPVFMWIYGMSLGMYASCLLLESLRLAVVLRRPAFALFLPLVFMTIHAASGWGIVIELVGGKSIRAENNGNKNLFRGRGGHHGQQGRQNTCQENGGENGGGEQTPKPDRHQTIPGG